MFTSWCFSEKVTWFQIIYTFAPITTTQGISAKMLVFHPMHRIGEAAQPFRETAIIVLLYLIVVLRRCGDHVYACMYLFGDIQAEFHYLCLTPFSDRWHLFVFYRAVPLGSNVHVLIICAPSRLRERYSTSKFSDPAQLFLFEGVRLLCRRKNVAFLEHFRVP